MERNIRLEISYDGTDFCGWQVQDRDRTVQGELEKALERIHGRHVRLTGSGRTDSGVHASAQIANFYTDMDGIPDFKFTPALNSLMPRDVRVRSSREVPAAFHSRFDARRRTYRYYIRCAETPEPWYDRYCWTIRRRPDINMLNTLVSPLVGEHDFTAFSAAGDPSESKIRRLYSAAFYPDGPFIVFCITGNAFLWRMVRSIVGTAVMLEQEGAEGGEMKRILESGDRKTAGTTAPAKGLFLDRIEYEC